MEDGGSMGGWMGGLTDLFQSIQFAFHSSSFGMHGSLVYYNGESGANEFSSKRPESSIFL